MLTATSNYHQTAQQISFEEEEIRAAINDIKQFDVLYDRYYVDIFRFIYRRCDSTDLAHDLCSQSFLKAMQKLHTYRFMGLPFASWLYRIAINELNMEFRKHPLKRMFNSSSENLLHIAGDMHEEVHLEKEELEKKLMQSLQTLVKSEIELVEMRYFEKRPYKEIAEITGESENSLKVKIHRIIQKLKIKMNIKNI